MVAGLVAKKITTLDRKLLFKDSTFFDVPEDFKTQEDDGEEQALMEDEKGVEKEAAV